MGLGVVKQIFNHLLSRIRWGGDLIPDGDGTQLVGGPVNGLHGVHITTDFFLVETDVLTLGLRNSGDTIYRNFAIGDRLLFNGNPIIILGDDKLTIGNTGFALAVVTLTTAQKEALTESQGMLVFDTDLDELEVVNDGTNWESLVATKEQFWGIHSEDEEVDYAVHSLVGALKDNYTGLFPHDMRAIKNMFIILIPKQNTVNMSWTTVNASIAQAANTHTDAGAINEMRLADNLEQVDITGEFATAVAGDFFGLELTGSGGNTYKVLGIRLLYR